MQESIILQLHIGVACICFDGETVGHLFLHFNITRKIRSLKFCFFGDRWVMLRMLVKLLHVGRDTLENSIILKFGKPFLHVYHGTFGNKGMCTCFTGMTCQ